MKIAPDVEKLMWLVAESADPKAVEDFESRFPHLRYELSKRLEMVRSLKDSGKVVRHEGSIPQFRRPVPVSSPFGPRLRWSIAALALSALAFGSFFATRALIPPRAPAVVNVQPEPVDVPLIEEPDSSVPNEPKIENPQDPAPSGVTPPEDQPVPGSGWERPQTVKFQRIGLASALKAIAAQCGLKMDIPSDMPNDEIVVDYRGMTAMEILSDMGSQFGFTAFDQGGGHVIIVPTREANAQDSGPRDSRPHTPRHSTGGDE